MEHPAVNRRVAGSNPARGARLVSESVSQIHIKKIALFRVDARIGLFLCCPGQGWPYGVQDSRVPFVDKAGCDQRHP